MDCRSQRYNLTDIGFPTRDGFWVSLEAIIEFRVKPEQAAATYILYNEERDDKTLSKEVVNKVILPNARAYTRLRGSNHSGKEFIAGDLRVAFQEDFQKTMKLTATSRASKSSSVDHHDCRRKRLPTVRRRQIALQRSQYKKEIEQQGAEQDWLQGDS